MGERSAQERYLRSITEAEWQRKVIAVAQLRGWWVFHDHDSRMNRAGMADLIMIRPPRFLCVELKTESGILKRDQVEFAEMVDACEGVEYHLWRPRHEKEMQACLK